ncbi:MAG: M6 family metalloprotease domain-containing protein [Muribaculaceae bacterium]|nr:M6 family metalloprotease domain-containing protein [Muribaculaceae bacterium]
MMKIKHIIAALALSLPGFVAARPADPRPRVLTNPDGTEVTVRVHGNEFFHFMTDESCSRILERDSRGFITDAVREGMALSCSKSIIEMLRMESEAKFPALESPSSRSSMQRMATLDREGRSNYPTIGKGNRSLVVLVEFSDVSFTVDNPKDFFTRQLNEPGFSDYGGQGSALDYYLASSNGLYAPQFDVYGPVKVSKEASYFDGMGNSAMSLLIRESLTALHDSGEVDFSNYDLDNDGVIDTVFFYYAGYGKADSDTETIWPHQFDYRYLSSFGASNSLRLDGKSMGPYACANELKGINPNTGRQPWKDGSEPWVDGIGAFVHEYGHVLGLPDLYDTNYTEGVEVLTPGKWSVMCSGSYNFNGCRPPLMSAYEQWLCRWLEYTDAEDASNYELVALGNSATPTAVKIGIPKNEYSDDLESEYFVVEARDSSGWDSCFPESGLVIWRINYNKNLWTNNSVNSKNSSNVVIHYAKGENYPAFTKENIFPGSPYELIPSKQYGMWKSPFITDIAYDAGSKTASFGYNMFSETPTGAPLLHDTPYADEGSARNFTLVWDPVDGADSYQVTIKRVSSGKVLGVYDELNVGNVTSLKVVSVPVTFWNYEIEVYVRAVKAIPCSDTSNVIRFVPKDLPKGAENNAVDEVGEEQVQISGGIGCVYAPEGSQVFDMQGHLMSSAESLPAGLYLVRYGSRTVKVLVK